MSFPFSQPGLVYCYQTAIAAECFNHLVRGKEETNVEQNNLKDDVEIDVIEDDGMGF